MAVTNVFSLMQNKKYITALPMPEKMEWRRAIEDVLCRIPSAFRIIDSPQFSFEGVAIEVTPMQLHKEMFLLPANINTTKSPY